MNTINNFLNTLFDPDDHTCFTPSPHGTGVFYEPADQDLYFSINPLHPDKDVNPSMEYHNANRARRADHNVTKYRNFLIELDSMPIDSQIDYVTSKLPVTSIVFSGGKSYHFIISLETPLATKAEYDQVFKRIQTLLPKIDKACKNPSRLSRLPFRLRPETQVEQKLVELNGRIPVDRLLSLLPDVPVYKHSGKPSNEFISVQLAGAITNPDQCMQEMGIQGRNQFFFWLGCRIKDLDFEYDRAYNIVTRTYANLKNQQNFPINEALSAARISGQ